MIWQEPLLVTLVTLVDTLPMPEPPRAGRGRPRVYADRLFLKALVIMIVRRLHNVRTDSIPPTQMNPQFE
jgi:hypothetical protein